MSIYNTPLVETQPSWSRAHIIGQGCLAHFLHSLFSLPDGIKTPPQGLHYFVLSQAGIDRAEDCWVDGSVLDPAAACGLDWATPAAEGRLRPCQNGASVHPGCRPRNIPFSFINFAPCDRVTHLLTSTIHSHRGSRKEEGKEREGEEKTETSTSFGPVYFPVLSKPSPSALNIAEPGPWRCMVPIVTCISGM